MPSLQKSALFAILIILIEASVRKYVYASPVVVLFKYVALFPLFLFSFNSFSRAASFSLLGISLPLLTTIPSFKFVPYALYDFASIFYLVVILFCLSLEKSLFNRLTSNRILVIVAIIGILNALLIILQTIFGPQHWLSQSVDQSFSVISFGESLKAPGLAGTSSPYMSIAGLISLDVLSSATSNKLIKRVCAFSQLFIGISVLFNLSSRTYSIGVISYVLPRFILPIFVDKRIHKSSYAYLLIPITYYVLQYFFEDWGLGSFSANRTFNEFDSASERLFSLPIFSFLSLSPTDVPLLGGLGLGYAVNSNPFADIFYSPPFCQALGLGTEGEYERLICSFGGIGILHIIARLSLAIVAFRNAIFFLKPRFPRCISAGWLFFSLVLCNGLLLRSNDTAAGTLLILLSLSASQSFVDSASKPFNIASVKTSLAP